MKKCFKCFKEKPITDFYKHPKTADGTVNKCKPCFRADSLSNYQKNKEKYIEYDRHRNRHSISRLLRQKYSMIKQRCTTSHSSQGVKKSVYGKEFLSLKEWIEWCYKEDNYKKFIELYNGWVQNNFDKKMSPSIDRIDSKKGYVLGNLQWLTLSDNCKKYNK